MWGALGQCLADVQLCPGHRGGGGGRDLEGVEGALAEAGRPPPPAPRCAGSCLKTGESGSGPGPQQAATASTEEGLGAASRKGN